MADAAGNDITLVGVPVTGFIGIGPAGTTLPADDEGNTDPLDPVLNAAIKKMGLLKTDGGPAVVWGPTGDAIQHWQDGYEIPSGESDVTVTATFAEILGPEIRKLASGAAVTGDGMTVVDGGGHSTKYVMWIEEIFKSGAIRRRALRNVGIRSWTEDKSTRGSETGAVVVFTVPRDLTIGTTGGHFREWVVPA